MSSRRIVVEADPVRDDRDVARLLHAVAQLPRSVSLKLDPSHLPRASRLAAAYGLSERLDSATQEEIATHAHLGPALEPDGLPDGVPRLPWQLNGRPLPTMADLVEALDQVDDTAGRPATSASGLEGQRIAVVTNIPIHYRIPLFEGLSETLQRSGGALCVFFTSSLASEGRRRPWLRTQPLRFEHRSLSDEGRSLGPILSRRAFEGSLDEYDPTILVAGGFSPWVTGRALAFARRRDITFGLWSGDTALQERSLGRLRGLERRSIARRSDFAIAYSWLASEYLQELAPGLPTVIGRNSAPLAEAAEPSADCDCVNLLAVSRAIPGKGLEVLVDAVLALPDASCRLTIAGDGPELSALRVQAGGSPKIRFLGAVASDRVADEYRKADVFLFPSRIDVFGLSLLEAMGSGLAIVTSRASGAASDLCVDQHNSLVVDARSAEGWSAAIRKLAGDPELRHRLGGNAMRTILRRWTVDHSIEAWLAGLRLAVSRRDS